MLACLKVLEALDAIPLRQLAAKRRTQLGRRACIAPQVVTRRARKTMALLWVLNNRMAHVRSSTLRSLAPAFRLISDAAADLERVGLLAKPTLKPSANDSNAPG